MEIVTKQTAVLIPYVNNARTHSTEQIKQIAASIKEFGFTNPILLDGDNGIIAGHGRVMAAELLKMADVPCIELPHLTPAQKKAYILADNKLALNAGWDDELLEAELKSLEELDFDVDLTGFDSDELSDIFRDGEAVEDDFDVDAEIEAIETPVTKLGDIWKLGNHRLMCGDSTDKETVAKLMDGNNADMSFTSPPYNVGHNLGYKTKDSKYINSDDDVDNYVELITKTTELSLIYARDVFVNIQLLANNKRDVLIWLASLSDRFKDIFFWKKSQVAPAMAENVANSQVEIICLFGSENNTRSWGNKKFRGNFSNHIETNSASGENKNAKIHNATFPIALPFTFIRQGYNVGSTIIDLFMGTGTTLIACEQNDCVCYGMELDEKYCDVIIKRWETLTGKQAEVIQSGTKQTTEEVL